MRPPDLDWTCSSPRPFDPARRPPLFWGGALSGTALRGGRCRGGRRARGGVVAVALGWASPPGALRALFFPPSGRSFVLPSFQVHCWGRGGLVVVTGGVWGARPMSGSATRWSGIPFSSGSAPRSPPGSTLHLRDCGLWAPSGHSSVGGGFLALPPRRGWRTFLQAVWRGRHVRY